jgi:DUF1365 family protein
MEQEDEFRNFTLAELIQNDEFRFFVSPFRGLDLKNGEGVRRPERAGVIFAVKAAGKERPDFYVFSPRQARTLAASLEAIADDVESDPEP